MFIMLDTKKNKIKTQKKNINLTFKEMRVMSMLSGNYPVTERDFFKSGIQKAAIANIICRIKRKIPEIDIICIQKLGYKLLNEIWIK